MSEGREIVIKHTRDDAAAVLHEGRRVLYRGVTFEPDEAPATLRECRELVSSSTPVKRYDRHVGVRLSDEQLSAIDWMVEHGEATSRSDAIRQAVDAFTLTDPTYLTKEELARTPPNDE